MSAGDGAGMAILSFAAWLSFAFGAATPSLRACRFAFLLIAPLLTPNDLFDLGSFAGKTGASMSSSASGASTPLCVAHDVEKWYRLFLYMLASSASVSARDLKVARVVVVAATGGATWRPIAEMLA